MQLRESRVLDAYAVSFSSVRGNEVRPYWKLEWRIFHGPVRSNLDKIKYGLHIRYVISWSLNSSLVLQSKISANGLWCGGGGGNGGRSRSDAGIGEDRTGTADAEMRERLKREREDNQTFPSHKDEGSWKRTSTMPENVMHYITSRVCWTLQGSQSTRQPPTTCTWCKNANDIGLMRALSLVGREVIMNNCVWLLSSPSERVWSQASPVTPNRKIRDMSLRLGLWATYYKYYQLVFSSLLLLTLWRHDCGYLMPAFCWFAYSLYWAWPSTPIEGLYI